VQKIVGTNGRCVGYVECNGLLKTLVFSGRSLIIGGLNLIGRGLKTAGGVKKLYISFASPGDANPSSWVWGDQLRL